MEEKCWRYPRTVRNYDALIQEFGDDLVSVTITRPSSVLGKETLTSLQAEVERLKIELTRKDNVIDSFSKANQLGQTSVQSENQVLKLALASNENELNSLKNSLKTIKIDKIKLETQITETLKEINRLTQTSRPSDFDQQIKRLAKGATGNDHDFCHFIDKLKIDTSLTIEIAKHLEKTLKRLLTTTENNLYELITQARDADILTDEAIQLAHLIRRHRNITAHEQVDIRNKEARVLLVLLSAALLWPLLPE